MAGRHQAPFFNKDDLSQGSETDQIDHNDYANIKL